MKGEIHDDKETNGIVTAGVLIVGDEILSGRTADKNVSYIAKHLNQVGIQLKEVRIVADDVPAIADALNALRERYDYVFTTGGIGPTHDDITADGVAAALGTGLEPNDEARQMLLERYQEHELTPARLRMTRIPPGARLIKNPISKAPGFMVDNVVVMAGIPSIMQVMLDDATQYLRKGRTMFSRAVNVDVPESVVADILPQIEAAHHGVSVGSYPYIREQKFGAQLVLRCLDEDVLNAAYQDLTARLTEMSCPWRPAAHVAPQGAPS